jgi:hypothetical protein
MVAGIEIPRAYPDGIRVIAIRGLPKRGGEPSGEAPKSVQKLYRHRSEICICCFFSWCALGGLIRPPPHGHPRFRERRSGG